MFYSGLFTSAPILKLANRKRGETISFRLHSLLDHEGRCPTLQSQKNAEAIDHQKGPLLLIDRLLGRVIQLVGFVFEK